MKVTNNVKRSNVNKCFVSFSSNANSDIITRDLKDDIKTLENIRHIHGNTQKMIDFISSSKRKVCMVIIDYAGLSTDPVNIQEFIRNNDAMEKLIVDCFPYTCDAVEFERCCVLNDISTLSAFNCRKTPRQRSKA
ncbi:uncharacterized protein EV154DRAFT_544570 [Mucor mucedo]|uniref:uncharacterized protein n=1 Tax=Mucor mucedo TaxID=29922 RepID=UPI00221E6233|nr:uncharacterized protein EV154DRAFT_544570 [Mucor mucedo]KAI7889254.1 hypothetical protein EV154DRAFT_544570 [Mucor mucedo]